LGKKNIVERLIENAHGITIVALDTRKHENGKSSNSPGKMDKIQHWENVEGMESE
jgi:hypothetical protein